MVAAFSCQESRVKILGPRPWADLESRYTLRFPRSYPVMVQGTIMGALLARSYQGCGKMGYSAKLNHRFYKCQSLQGLTFRIQVCVYLDLQGVQKYGLLGSFGVSAMTLPVFEAQVKLGFLGVG